MRSSTGLFLFLFTLALTPAVCLRDEPVNEPLSGPPALSDAESSSAPAAPAPERYYRLSTHSSHLDGRFTHSHNINDNPDLRGPALRALTQSFLLTMQDLKVTPFLAHGTLLGHHWGGHGLPWDEDVDMHVLWRDMRFIAAYYNMTVHHPHLPAAILPRRPEVVPNKTHGKQHQRQPKPKPTPQGNKDETEYLLDINPHFRERDGVRDHKNVIDARWIDMSNGLYIDITALVEIQDPEDDDAYYLVAKDGNSYRREDILPLRNSAFEGVGVFVPNDARAVLTGEYGEEALVRDVWNGHEYDRATEQWVALPSLSSRGALKGLVDITGGQAR